MEQMFKEHIYRGNKIIEYPDGTFLTTKTKGGDIQSRYCSSLEEARHFIMRPRKLITDADVRGIKRTEDVLSLLSDINRKGDINGWAFSSWWFDYRHSKGEEKAMSAVIWQLLVNNIERLGFRFNSGAEAQLRLREAATFVGGKLNGVWWETIVKWLRGMAYSGYGITVNDRYGLDCIFLKIKNQE